MNHISFRESNKEYCRKTYRMISCAKKTGRAEIDKNSKKATEYSGFLIVFSSQQ
jgi:hypothetical protein